MLRLLLDELLLRRRGEGGAEGRGGPRGGGGREKSHLARGWILRYEPLCEVLGVVREEFSFIGVYTRGGNSFIFAHRMCRVHAHVHARAYMYTHARHHPPLAIILLCIDARTRARARSTIACPADAIRSMGAIFAYCGFQKRRCATSSLSFPPLLPNTLAC